MSRAPVTPRVKVGVALSALGLVFLVYPGFMFLPSALLLPFAQPAHGCFAPAGSLSALLAVGFGFVVSCLLIGVGIASLIATGLGLRGGLVAAIAFDAVLASLLLAAPIGFASDPADSGVFLSYLILDVCALVPAGAIALLLSRKVFQAWSMPGVFKLAAGAAGIILLLGIAGLAEFGIQAVSVRNPVPVMSTTPTGALRC